MIIKAKQRLMTKTPSEKLQEITETMYNNGSPADWEKIGVQLFAYFKQAPVSIEKTELKIQNTIVIPSKKK
jgi:hypothetical protein